MALRCWSQEESLCSGTMASTITRCLDLKPAANWERTFMFAKMAPDLTFFQKVSDFNKLLLYWCLKENKTVHMSSDGGIVVSTADLGPAVRCWAVTNMLLIALFCIIASVIVVIQAAFYTSAFRLPGWAVWGGGPAARHQWLRPQRDSQQEGGTLCPQSVLAEQIQQTQPIPEPLNVGGLQRPKRLSTAIQNSWWPLDIWKVLNVFLTLTVQNNVKSN